jgi:hypothetical protein
MTFDNLAQQINYAHYFDTEVWYRDVLKTPYDIVISNDFGIIFEYRMILGHKVGHSRGGILFDRSKKTLEEYHNFVSYLKSELSKLNYAFVGIDFVEGENEFNKIFERSKVRDHINGTAYIYPKEDWIKKFNSKKRSDLLSAQRKGVNIHLFSNIDKELSDEIDLERFYALVLQTLQRHENAYTLPTKETFGRMFKDVKFILAVAQIDNEWISYNLSIFNPMMNRLERVFAGSNEKGLKFRAPSLIEVNMVEYLAQRNVEVYDLWGVKDPEDGVSIFKKSIADEWKLFRPYGILKIQPIWANLTLFALKISKYFR